MIGDPKKGNPQEPNCNLAGAVVQGGSRASVCSPAQKELFEDGIALSREASSYANGSDEGNTEMAACLPTKEAGSRPFLDALLGNKARTPASLEPCGFQCFSGASESTSAAAFGRALAVFTMGYPTGIISYQAVDFDPAEYRADPAGYLDRIEAGLPEGAYLIGVERRGGRP